jgi:PST family polysaccharide transporter
MTTPPDRLERPPLPSLTGRFARQVGALYLLQIANYIIPLVLLPYLTRVLEPERFGLVSFAQGLMFLFALLVNYGFSLSGTRAVALARADPERFSRVAADIWGAKLALLAAALVVLVALLAAAGPLP